MNLRKPAIAFASSSSASITSSSRAQGSEDFRLHIAVKRLIGRRCLPPPSLPSTEWSSGGLPGTRAATTYRVLLFLAAGCARARAPASWSWRRRAAGGRGGSAVSFVCSCDSTSKRALERARSGAADVPRLLLRQYVQESFGAPRGHG